MGGTVKKIANVGTRVGLDTLTGGLAEIRGLSSKAGGMVGNFAGNLLGGGNYSAPNIGQQSPMQMLTTTGGAPLLMNIALGADVDDSIASFLGIPKKEMLDALNGRNSVLGTPEQAKATVAQISSIRNQLMSVQKNTNLRNQAVQKLVDDFPNIMTQKIQQYSSIADDATKQMMQQALDQVGAKYAAGGMLSSGATAEAAAKAGADIGMQKLQYGTALAGQDWQNQYNNATALQSFQQKMLGQGAMNGFNAVQNALGNNNSNAQLQTKMDFLTGNQNTQDQQAMWGAVGGAAGTALGGPIGGFIGNVFGNLGKSNKLNSGAIAGQGA